MFLPLAVESFGVWTPHSIETLKRIAARTTTSRRVASLPIGPYRHYLDSRNRSEKTVTRKTEAFVSFCRINSLENEDLIWRILI